MSLNIILPSPFPVFQVVDPKEASLQTFCILHIQATCLANHSLTGFTTLSSLVTCINHTVTCQAISCTAHLLHLSQVHMLSRTLCSHGFWHSPHKTKQYFTPTYKSCKIIVVHIHSNLQSTGHFDGITIVFELSEICNQNPQYKCHLHFLFTCGVQNTPYLCCGWFTVVMYLNYLAHCFSSHNI